MIALRLPALRLNSALTVTAILLAALALWPWLVPPRPAMRPRAAPHGAAPPPTLAPLPPLTSYAAVVERPLFSPSRRAPRGAVAAGLGPPIEGRYRLAGIIGTGPRRKAFIADGPRHLEIAEGDMLDGWAVKQIGQDRVLLQSAAGDAVLKLGRAPPEPAKVQ